MAAVTSTLLTRPDRRRVGWWWGPRLLLLMVSMALSVVPALSGGAVPLVSASVGPGLGGLKQAPAEAGATADVEPGVVRIDTVLPLQSAVGAGTGVVLTPDGVVLTNNHVVRGATSITATVVGTGQNYPVDVLGYDRTSDIAVLQLRGAQDLPVAPTADSSTVRVGDAVTGVGFAGGGGLSRAPGAVRALGQSIVANDELTGSSERLADLIETSARIEAGDSGGPLVNSAGQVIGIDTAASQTYQMKSTGGFTIPLNQALAISDAIRSGAGGGAVHLGPTAILGVAVQNAGDQRGVAVQGVLRGSAAEQAGLAGGVITGLDGTTIGDATALTDLLDRHRPGDTVTVTYLDRAQTSRSVPVTLAEGPPD